MLERQSSSWVETVREFEWYSSTLTKSSDTVMDSYHFRIGEQITSFYRGIKPSLLSTVINLMELYSISRLKFYVFSISCVQSCLFFPMIHIPLFIFKLNSICLIKYFPKEDRKISHRHMKRWPISVIIREKQIKTTMKFISVKMTVIKKTRDKKILVKMWWKGILCIDDGNVN